MATNTKHSGDDGEGEGEEKNSSGNKRESIRPELSYDKVASKLLKDSLLLTALELHAELLENGIEVPRLRDYFSNPAHFEVTSVPHKESSPSILRRTSSLNTFDSTEDFPPYSEDGDRTDEKVAVLEFELRKANETINQLRAILTQATEKEKVSSPDTEADTESLEEKKSYPHEKRAINFLIQEYLLSHNYKLTSVTFADENTNQDLEDWDDVGLNTPKPPDVLHLYRDYGHHVIPPKETADFSCDVDFVTEMMDAERRIWESTKEELTENQRLLEEKTETLQQEKDSLDELAQKLESDFRQLQASRRRASLQDRMLHIPPELNRYPSEPSEPAASEKEQQDERVSVATMEELGCINECKREVSKALKRLLVDKISELDSESRLSAELASIAETADDVVSLLGRSLPQVVRLVKKNGREELLPLILCAVLTHPDPRTRDVLSNLLFNLIPRPDEAQRRMILAGCVAFAQQAGFQRVQAELLPQCWEQVDHKVIERRMLVAQSCGALAPYMPGDMVSSLLFSILRQLLSDDKSPAVKCHAIHSLAALTLYMDDVEKYQQVKEILISTLDASDESLVEATLKLFLPAVALWAVERRALSDLIVKYLDYLQSAIKKKGDSDHDTRCIHLVTVLRHFLPFLFYSTLRPFIPADRLDDNQDWSVYASRFPAAISELADIKKIVGNDYRSVALFDVHVSRENFEQTDELSWISTELVHRLLGISDQLSLSSTNLIEVWCTFVREVAQYFGYRYTVVKIKVVFESKFQSDRELLEKEFNSGVPCSYRTASHVVYAMGVLMAFIGREEYQQALDAFLRETIPAFASFGCPMESLRSTVEKLVLSAQSRELCSKSLRELCMHKVPSVRAAAVSLLEFAVGEGNDEVLSSQVLQILITLSLDPDVNVRMATISPFARILATSHDKSLLERAHIQFQSFFDDPYYDDHYPIKFEMLKALTKYGPQTEPKYRDDVILPRLAVTARKNNTMQNPGLKKDFALAMLEVYNALCCCFISDQALRECLLPGLCYLKADIAQLAGDQLATIEALLAETEAKVKKEAPVPQSAPSRERTASGSSLAPPPEKAQTKGSKIFHRLAGLRDKTLLKGKDKGDKNHDG